MSVFPIYTAVMFAKQNCIPLLRAFALKIKWLFFSVGVLLSVVKPASTCY